MDPGGRRAEGWAPGLVDPAAAVAISRPWAAMGCHGPLIEAVNAMRLGVREREHGGVASMLGPPPLFPVPGPKACVRAGGRLVPRGPASSREQGRVVSVLGRLSDRYLCFGTKPAARPPLFSFPGPKACARAGGRPNPEHPEDPPVACDSVPSPRVGPPLFAFTVPRARLTNIDATGGRDA